LAPLLGWVLAWGQGPTLALALDATAQGDLVVALGLRVLYRGSAIPVAWVILPANQPGAWMPAIVRLVRQLPPAVPASMTVLLLADRGLWSPQLGPQWRTVGWHPVVRLKNTTTLQPQGQGRQPALRLVPGPGWAWGGAGIAFKAGAKRQPGTLVVVWDAPPRRPGCSGPICPQPRSG
jgi:hypothetical protein